MGLKSMLKRPVKRFAEGVINFIERHRQKIPDDVGNNVRRRSIEQSTDFVYSEMATALALPQHRDVLRYAMSHRAQGLLLEFGVFKGDSINRMAKMAPSQEVYGFDSFEGLPEDWPGSWATKGTFDLKAKLPKVRSNVKLVKGWFDQTLPEFLKNHGEPIGLLHVDCDLYSSAKFVLDTLQNRIQPGTVIVFDEFFGYPFFQDHEFRAFFELVKECEIRFRYLAYAGEAVAVVVQEVKHTIPHKGF